MSRTSTRHRLLLSLRSPQLELLRQDLRLTQRRNQPLICIEYWWTEMTLHFLWSWLVAVWVLCWQWQCLQQCDRLPTWPLSPPASTSPSHWSHSDPVWPLITDDNRWHLNNAVQVSLLAPCQTMSDASGLIWRRMSSEHSLISGAVSPGKCSFSVNSWRRKQQLLGGYCAIIYCQTTNDLFLISSYHFVQKEIMLQKQIERVEPIHLVCLWRCYHGVWCRPLCDNCNEDH